MTEEALPRAGTVEVLDYLQVLRPDLHARLYNSLRLSPDLQFTAEHMRIAAASGNLAVVEYLHRHSAAGCTTDALDGAARHGHTDVVRFLCTQRSEGGTTAAMDIAAIHGHLEILELLQRYRPADGCTSRAILKARGLAVIEFLYRYRPECRQLNAAQEARLRRLPSVAEYLNSWQATEPRLPRLDEGV